MTMLGMITSSHQEGPLGRPSAINLPELAHAAALIPLDPPAKTKPAKRKPVQAATGPPER